MADGDGDDQAAQAFESLRAEVSSMRRAVDRLVAGQAEAGQGPDYSETLGVIAQRVDALAKSPALSLTPEEIGRQIDAASLAGRREDQRLFVAARQGLDEVVARLGRHLQSDIAAADQRRRLWRTGLAGLGTGMALWAILAGPIVRELPASWLSPERMAARTLRMPMWEGGQRLMRTSDPHAYAGVLAGNRLATANRETLAACRRQAAKAGKPVRCAIEVGTGE